MSRHPSPRDVHTRLAGRANQQLIADTIAAYGPYCWLRMPGCQRLATTRDHVIPVSRGGSDALTNLRPACKHCNSRRQNRIISGTVATIHTVIGPPAAGKTTFVTEHAKPTDITIDLDKLATALMAGPPAADHDYPHTVRRIAIGAREAAIWRATRISENTGVWIIQSIPTPEMLGDWVALHYEVHVIDPGRTIVEQRAAHHRPGHVAYAIAKWYATYPTPAHVARYLHRPDWAEPAPTDTIKLEPSRTW